jgi:anti-sigma28 factor (negative regulator of flagellin synthesis)
MKIDKLSKILSLAADTSKNLKLEAGLADQSALAGKALYGEAVQVSKRNFESGDSNKKSDRITQLRKEIESGSYSANSKNVAVALAIELL